MLVGERTRYLYKFVRWEIEICQNLDIPIIAVNLNGRRRMDPERCLPLLQGKYVVHVSFQMKIIKYALDSFPNEYQNRDPNTGGDRYYNNDVYRNLDL